MIKGMNMLEDMNCKNDHYDGKRFMLLGFLYNGMGFSIFL